MLVGATPSRTMRSDVRPVLAQIDERGARAIRPAVEIDLLVTEILANVVQIVHGDAGRVEAHVGVELAEALRAAVAMRVLLRGESGAQRSGIGGTVQRMRSARASLIDEHDVAMALHALERRANVVGHLRRPLSRAAGQEEERVRAVVVAQ